MSSVSAHPIAAVPPPPVVVASNPIHTHDEALSLVLDTYDTLVAPQVAHPSELSPSLTAVRRHLFRKQFQLEAVRILRETHAPFHSVDDLVDIVSRASAGCGLILL